MRARYPNSYKNSDLLISCYYDLSALSHLRHVLLQPVQDSLFKSGDIALADAHDIRHLLLRLFRAAAQPEAQAHDLLFPCGELGEGAGEHLPLDRLLDGAIHHVALRAEDIRKQQLVSVPVGVERLVKADLGLLRRGLAQVHEYLIFNAARGVGRELDVLVAAVGVHRLDEPDRTDGDEVFDVDAGIFKPARDVGDKPQVVLNERAQARNLGGTAKAAFRPKAGREAAFLTIRRSERFR